MDKYYGNVCELDIIFNFQKAYFILDELLLAGELQESSKKNVLRCIGQQDSLEDMEVSGFVVLHHANEVAPSPFFYPHSSASLTHGISSGRGRHCHQDHVDNHCLHISPAYGVDTKSALRLLGLPSPSPYIHTYDDC